MRVFNPDQFFKRRDIFSSENFGPGDQNFQDQNSRDTSHWSECLSVTEECGAATSLTSHHHGKNCLKVREFINVQFYYIENKLAISA